MEKRAKQKTQKGPAENFTGDVFIDNVSTATEQVPVTVAFVRFTPGARTAWHSHSLGQTLYVTEGEGRAQVKGGEVMVLRTGDVLYTAPNEEHWHGAAPDHFMTHLAITGGEARWGAHVTEEEYGS